MYDVGINRLQVGERQGVADARHDVLALRVPQVVAVRNLLAGAGVARERHPCAGIVAAVAEHHRLHVHRGPERVADLVLAPVVDRAPAVPALEDRFDRQAHLLARVRRELLAGVLAVDAQELRRQRRQVVGVEVGVGGALTLGVLRAIERFLEGVGRHVHHDLAEHLDEPAVGIAREPHVAARLLGQPLQRFLVEAQVQDGVHHAGHRELGAGPDADQQRVAGIAEPLAHG